VGDGDLPKQAHVEHLSAVCRLGERSRTASFLLLLLSVIIIITMNINELLKEAQQKALKPTATVVRRCNGKIHVYNEELLSEKERERRVSASEEAGKLRQEEPSSGETHNDDSIIIRPSVNTRAENRPIMETEKTRQLVALGEAMGGPRFPNFALRPSQRDDDVEAFEPLLHKYLQQEGEDRSVNDTASFQDYFGQDISLHEWSLLMVAASIWVNAPRCMKLLLDLGANPLQKDSSGRHVLTEALATARHGKFGPWEVLRGLQQEQQQQASPHLGSSSSGSSCSSIVITAEKIKDAKLCDITEAMIVALRSGKAGITPPQTQNAFLQMWNHGFRLHARHYRPNEIRQHFHEMILIRFDELASLQCLPARHEASRWTFQQVMDLEQEQRDSVKILFLSHRWLRPHMGHPDCAGHSKFAAFLDIGRQYCQQAQVAASDLFFWIDYSCIDQSVPSIKTRCIQSLPLYILISDGFVWIEHPDYMIRAWCMLEILFGSSMPVKTRNFDFCKYSASRCALEIRNESFQGTDPQCGGVTDLNDMHYIRSLTWFAEKLYKWM
jgi:hypothetical protein